MFSKNKEECEASTVCGRQVGRWAGGSLTRRPKVPLLSPGQTNVVNKDARDCNCDEQWKSSRSNKNIKHSPGYASEAKLLLLLLFTVIFLTI